MGLNDEYSRDAYLPEEVGTDPQHEVEEDPFEDFTQEDWEDWYSQDLLDMYMGMREWYESQYLPVPVTFNKFCDLVYTGQIPVPHNSRII